MGTNSNIEWTDHTFNPWEGCTEVSPSCANCYAKARNHRFGLDNWGKGKPRRRTSAANWKLPLKWNFEAVEYPYLCGECGARFKDPETLGNPWACSECNETLTTRRPRVFCASLADWLDDEVPIEWLADLLKLIHDTPNLDWLLLTKRPENWRQRIEEAAALWQDAPEYAEKMAGFLDSWTDCIDMPERGDIPLNVWIGTTVEDQKRADERIPELLNIPAKVRFLSCEPLLEKVLLDNGECSWLSCQGTPECDRGEGCLSSSDGGEHFHGIDWVICGGESGPRKRLFNPAWALSLRDQCAASGVPFFMKQIDKVQPIPEDLLIRQFPA